ncbi:DeoR family transcriptional regulator [Brucella endophytica]|uniref:DeoR family transcriptional regulator n=1 Tax=Brucella endophytica TaxID=1963359 RepID=A0A916SM80_9HYPH|nr:DeoR family transcriptional regulator [Brucella endophytica]
MRLRDAASYLGVSEMTVRRDIGSDGEKLNCLGGYVIPTQDSATPSDYVLDHEKDCHAIDKARACAVAASLIEPQDTVFIDCGTTTPHLARQIPSNSDITVICYSLNVAEVLAVRSDVRLIMLGGLYHPQAASFSGDESIEALRRININKAFLSAGGVDERHGITCSHFHEVPLKQMAMQRSVQKHLVVDSSKFGKVRAARYASIQDFNSIISDQPTS